MATLRDIGDYNGDTSRKGAQIQSYYQPKRHHTRVKVTQWLKFQHFRTEVPLSWRICIKGRFKRSIPTQQKTQRVALYWRGTQKHLGINQTTYQFSVKKCWINLAFCGFIHAHHVTFDRRISPPIFRTRRRS